MKKLSLFAVFVLCLSINLFSQFKISGSISDSSNAQALVGATIRFANSYNGVFSDFDGNFLLKNVKKGSTLLEISFLGYEKKIIEFNLKNDTVINIALVQKAIITYTYEIKGFRILDNTPTTFKQINKKQIELSNTGQDITYLMNSTPSVVVSSDAGTGIGYTGIRIRGSDATRINITINGIPVNDAESQAAYWVDLPDIASSVDNIQIQRGVGTSTNGAGAFGASMNIQTIKLSEQPYATINSSFGSFNTIKNTASFGTGLIEKKWTFDGRLSKLNSDGYIDRAFSDLKSFYFSGGYYGKKSILKFIVFSGKERTYQAWYGVPQDSLTTNRTYNIYDYKNQTDNYQQDNYQIHYSYEFTKKLNFTTALHLTKGSGYYEEYKDSQEYGNYGLENPIIVLDTIKYTDLIRQRWLDNNFYGFIYSLNYDNFKNLQITFGGAANQYKGDHYGKIVWAQFAGNSTNDKNYYQDYATKNDVNAYLKTNYKAGKKIILYGDLQYRTVYYSFLGFNSDLENVQQTANLNFFNPKAGISYLMNSTNTFYLSHAIGNKEPNRDDFVQSTPESRPLPEHLNNTEFGYIHKAQTWMFTATMFSMIYKNQLVLTGKINDVGEYNRINIPKSYRLGIELEFGCQPWKKLEISGNIALSENKILEYTEYIDNWDNWTQISIYEGKTDISFSPGIVAGGNIMYNISKSISAAFQSKYVGKQYLDNSSNPDRMINSWFVNDLKIQYSIKPKFMKEISISLALNNVFDELYESNGWTYSYINGGKNYTENWFFPQAGRNYMASVSLKF